MKMIILIFPLALYLCAFGQTPANDPHWELVWDDNFDTLNTNKWEVANNFDHYGDEAQVYTNRYNNVFISNGSLVLRVRKETYSCPSENINEWECKRQYETGQPYSYTSGWVESKKAYNTQFGYIESEIKLPHGYGFWPAFWTYKGAGVQVSNIAEIDIFEMHGRNPSNIVSTNIHKAYCDCDSEPYHYSCSGCSFMYEQLCPDYDNTILCYAQELKFSNFTYTNWHKYGIEWSPTKIIWYIDDFPVRTMVNHGIIDPVRIILNLAISSKYLPDSSTPFPSDMLVNYVKVYDLKKDCNTIINTCNYNFLNYDNKVKKEIIIGGSGCINSIPVNTNQFLRATDGILINGDFTVPIGSQLYLDVNPCY